MAMLTRTTSEAEDSVKTTTKKTMRTKISQVNKHSHSFPRVGNPLLGSAVLFKKKNKSAFVGFLCSLWCAGSNFNAKNEITEVKNLSSTVSLFFAKMDAQKVHSYSFIYVYFKCPLDELKLDYVDEKTGEIPSNR